MIELFLGQEIWWRYDLKFTRLLTLWFACHYDNSSNPPSLSLSLSLCHPPLSLSLCRILTLSRSIKWLNASPYPLKYNSTTTFNHISNFSIHIQIAETYSFLPREAVTRFLMSCSDCQKRMHLTMETNNNSQSGDGMEMVQSRDDDAVIMDLDLPISSAYLSRDRHARMVTPMLYNDEVNMSSASFFHAR